MQQGEFDGHHRDQGTVDPQAFHQPGGQPDEQEQPDTNSSPIRGL